MNFQGDNFQLNVINELTDTSNMRVSTSIVGQITMRHIMLVHYLYSTGTVSSSILQTGLMDLHSSINALSLLTIPSCTISMSPIRLGHFGTILTSEFNIATAFEVPSWFMILKIPIWTCMT